MSVARYMVQLVDIFIKWWWASLTGVASILGWLALPNGFSIGRVGTAMMIFGALTLILLTTSVLVQGYRWYLGSVGPEVLKFIPKQASAGPAEHMFVVGQGGWSITRGHVFSIYRDMRGGEEVCIAILRVDSERDDRDLQCVPIWMSDFHVRDLATDPGIVSRLRVRREVSERAVATLKEQK